MCHSDLLECSFIWFLPPGAGLTLTMCQGPSTQRRCVPGRQVLSWFCAKDRFMAKNAIESRSVLYFHAVSVVRSCQSAKRRVVYLPISCRWLSLTYLPDGSGLQQFLIDGPGRVTTICFRHCFSSKGMCRYCSGSLS